MDNAVVGREYVSVYVKKSTAPERTISIGGVRVGRGVWGQN